MLSVDILYNVISVKAAIDEGEYCKGMKTFLRHLNLYPINHKHYYLYINIYIKFSNQGLYYTLIYI